MMADFTIGDVIVDVTRDFHDETLADELRPMFDDWFAQSKGDARIFAGFLQRYMLDGHARAEYLLPPAWEPDNLVDYTTAVMPRAIVYLAERLREEEPA